MAEKYFKLYADDDEAAAAEDALVADVDLWEDPDFKADGYSLYQDPFKPPLGSLPPDVVEWNRISQGEITDCSAPVTFSDGTSAADVIQGQLGNCWFISAMSVMATHSVYVGRNFVSERNASKGIYTLKFFKQGMWRYVHIDDRIACDRKGKPVFAHGKDPNEVWVMLLEKAYAKLHGCYEALKTGYIDYGLRDLTGGTCIKMKWADKATAPLVASGKLYTMMAEALQEGSLAGCSFNTGNEGEIEHDRGDGILSGHAYGILQMQVCEADGDTFQMIQCRNPWGMAEWKGDWCDHDVLWEDYPEIKEKLNPGPFINDGTFWIEWKDFREQFNQVFLCYDFPDEWENIQFIGAWQPGHALSGHGGCPKYSTFPRNPQFTFEVEEDARIVVSVSREDNRWKHKNAPYTDAVGFVVMKCDGDRVNKFNPREMVGMSRTFAKMRTVSSDMNIKAGRYAVIPCLFAPGKAVDSFMMVINISCSAKFDQEGTEIADIDECLESGKTAAERFTPGITDRQVAPPDVIEDIEVDRAEDLGHDDLFDAPKDEAHEPEEEGRGLKLLHEMVGDLAAEVKGLAAEIATLTDRLDALES